MEAVVFRDSTPQSLCGEWFVSIRVAGTEVDVAGPFDDETDATLAAERMVDL